MQVKFTLRDNIHNMITTIAETKQTKNHHQVLNPIKIDLSDILIQSNNQCLPSDINNGF